MSEQEKGWEQIRQCRPTLLSHIDYESSQVRDERWLVLRNRVNGDHIRVNESAAPLLACLDGKQTVEQLMACEQIAAHSPADIINLLVPMLSAGMITLGSEHEDERLLHQLKLQKKLARYRRFGNPLAVRFPLLNPDAWLGHFVERTPFLWTRHCVAALFCLILIAVVVALSNLSDIVAAFNRVSESPTHWWLYALLYPVLKAVHELAHAIAVKRFGGAVHESGITLLVLMPIPYIDASDAWLFPQKSQRMLVGVAGMLAECAVAALGLFVFLLVQPGLLQEFGFALFLLGSIATLLFNANPLLKFDGYYILQDWLEIPNLASRAKRYCHYLLKKSVLRVNIERTPVHAAGESPWLITYGVLSTAYRFFITMVIALFLASQYMLLGTALALYALFQLLIKPIFQLINYLRHSPELADNRTHSFFTTAGLSVASLLLVALLPLPSSTRAEGVVWVPNQAQVFAAESGVINELVTLPGTLVQEGQILLRLHAPELRTRMQVVTAQLDALLVQYRSLQQLDQTQASTLATDIASLELEQSLLTKQIDQLDIRAAMAGQFVLDKDQVLPGRFVNQGELLGYIVNKEQLTVKAVLSQHRIERLQNGVVSARVRLADRFSDEINAHLTRQTPAASNDLPSPALAYDGTSGIAVASQKDEELKTLERVFHIELALPQLADIAGIGGRAYVTLQHQPESLGKRWWRSTRQLLLKRLTV